MTNDSTRHGAYTTPEQMLTTMQDLTVELTKANVRLDAVISNQERTISRVDKQDEKIEGLQKRLYTMSGVIGIVVSVATNWITGQVNS